VVQTVHLSVDTPYDRALVTMNRSLQAEDLALPGMWSRKRAYTFTIGGAPASLLDMVIPVRLALFSRLIWHNSFISERK
jgi:hypothetical protein